MKTYSTHPWIWDSPPEYSIVVTERIMKANVEKLLRWKCCYYNPEMVSEDTDTVDDHKYDVYENGLKSMCPEHPFLQLVGWSDDYFELLNWRTPAFLALDLNALSEKYPGLPWIVE